MSGDVVATDAASKVGGVGMGFGGYFDDGAGGQKEGFVARGNVGEDEGLRIGGTGDGELEVGLGFFLGWVRGGERKGRGRDD